MLTLPDSLAIGVFSVWAVAAAVALLRVMAGFWQVNQIRLNSEAIAPEELGPEVEAALGSFPRAVTLRTSDHVHVPAAIGFLRPAVVVPGWFLEEMSPAELQQVVLHELTHLRRRDDWTNLAQKIIKAVLFFHPLVWWLEQRLSLEREMACDDAVLAQSASPQRYAECLARLAQKSLVRKRISLAQALVGRVRQLSLRVAQILDVNRPNSTRIWKPAIPLVMGAAALCGFSAWSAPELVSFQSQSAAMISSHEMQASVPLNASQPRVILAGASLDRTEQNEVNSRFLAPLGMTKKQNTRSLHTASKLALSRDDGARKGQTAQPAGDYVFHAEQLVIATSGTGQPQMVQVSFWQMSIVAPAEQQAPPGKTVSRKKI